MLKIALGSVQFGLSYGISNPDRNAVSGDEVRKILHYAHEQGIEKIDTAANYGTSEAVLGAALTSAHLPFKIITKTASYHYEEAFEVSGAKLQQEKLYGLMVHHAEDLLKPEGEALFAWMQRLKREGQIEKLGCSFYTREQIEAVLQKFPLEIIQVPMNIFDQRLLAEGFLADLQARGIEVYVRSVFLQGFIFLTPEQLPLNIRTVGGECLAKFQRLLAQYQLNAVELALAFFKAQLNLTLVIGVTCLKELVEIMCAFHKIIDLDLPREIFQSLACEDPLVLNPALWSKP